MDLEIVVQDDTGDEVELTSFCETYGDYEGVGNCSVGVVPDAEGRLPLNLSLEPRSMIPYPQYPGCTPDESTPKYQRVSVDNLSTGQTWSKTVPVDGSVGLQVYSKPGDRMQVRHNTRTLGVLAMIGSGITVVDLNLAYQNRLYRITHDGAECGRSVRASTRAPRSISTSSSAAVADCASASI